METRHIDGKMYEVMRNPDGEESFCEITDGDVVVKENARIEDKAAEDKQTFTIEDWEIFSVGKWNGDKFTDKDLQDMVDSFKVLGHQIKPHLKLGHAEKQKLLQNDGFPAAGWITDLKKKGDKLLATVSGIPEKIFKLIKSGAYGRVSSEIYFNLKEGGKNFRRVLRAVALLGANTPAVSNLDDFINLYENSDYEDLKLCTDKENNNMDFEKKIQEMENKIKQFELDSKDAAEKIEILTKDNSKLNDEIIEKDYDTREVGVDAYLETAIKDGKVLPAQVDMFKQIAMDVSEVKMYSDEKGKSVECSNFDLVKIIINGNPKLVELSEKSEKIEIEKTSTKLTELEKDAKTPEEIQAVKDDAELVKKVEKYAKENDVDYKVALIEVSREG